MMKNADDDLVVSAMLSAEAEVMEFREAQVGLDDSTGLFEFRHSRPLLCPWAHLGFSNVVLFTSLGEC